MVTHQLSIYPHSPQSYPQHSGSNSCLSQYLVVDCNENHSLLGNLLYHYFNQ